MQKQTPSAKLAAARPPSFPLTLPRGSFALDAAIDDRLRLNSGATPRSGSAAHPIFGFVAALGGSGLSVAEILDRCGHSIDDGPVLAACEIDWDRTLQVGSVYQVDGEVSAMRRKPSRRFGAADHLHLCFTVLHEDETFARVRLHMIIPAA